jgi:hypothetical protein
VKIIPKLFSPFTWYQSQQLLADFFFPVSPFSVFPLLLYVFSCLGYSTISDDSIKSTVVPPSSSTANPLKGNGTNSDSHSVQITTIRLNGDNFLLWSQSIRMYIRGRGKMGYLIGEKTAPAEADPTNATWDVENSMFMTWLVNSMEEDISSNCMCYPTAQEL